LKSAELPNRENERLEALIRYEVLDSEDEKVFDELTQLASEICGTSISLISLVDQNRQWFKSRVGLAAKETERSIAFCSHAILQDDVFEVENALDDERFHDNPLVTNDPNIRFYAGAPLVTPDGYRLGTLCVIDDEPHTLNAFQIKALKILSNQVISQLEVRLNARRLERMMKDKEKLYATLAHDLRSPFNGVLNLSKILSERAEQLTPEQIVNISTEILNSSVSLFQTMDEILQWTQNQLVRSVIELKPENLKEAADETIDMFMESAKAKKVSISVDIAPDIEVMADGTLLKTILRNLITNAIKYAPLASLVSVAASVQSDHILISVSDQGKGIDETLKRSLFKETVQSQQGTRGEVGHGLGLSLAGDFVRRQSGKIWIDEEHEPGTRILVSLLAPA